MKCFLGNILFYFASWILLVFLSYFLKPLISIKLAIKTWKTYMYCKMYVYIKNPINHRKKHRKELLNCSSLHLFAWHNEWNLTLNQNAMLRISNKWASKFMISELFSFKAYIFFFLSNIWNTIFTIH